MFSINSVIPPLPGNCQGSSLGTVGPGADGPLTRGALGPRLTEASDSYHLCSQCAPRAGLLCVLSCLGPTLSFWLVVSGSLALGPWLWSSVLGKSLIPEFFFLFLRCALPWPVWARGQGEPVSELLSKTMVLVSKATGPGSDHRG